MSKRRPAVQPPPLWARWALASIVAVAVIVAIVIAVQRAGPENNTSEAAVEGETNRIADISITEDEAPRTAALPGGAAVLGALTTAIGGDVRKRISDGQLTGPLQHVSCTAATARGGAARVPYSCTVRSAGINYSFLAVAEASAKRLTWCKVDPSAAVKAGPEVPISPRCKA